MKSIIPILHSVARPCGDLKPEAVLTRVNDAAKWTLFWSFTFDFFGASRNSRVKSSRVSFSLSECRKCHSQEASLTSKHVLL